MPLPFGHSLMGYSLYEAIPNGEKSFSWRMLIVYVVVANLPDIDFLPGLIQGNPNKYHHHFTHSITFCMLVGTIFALYFFKKQGKKIAPCFLIFTLSLDILG